MIDLLFHTFLKLVNTVFQEQGKQSAFGTLTISIS